MLCMRHLLMMAKAVEKTRPELDRLILRASQCPSPWTPPVERIDKDILGKKISIVDLKAPQWTRAASWSFSCSRRWWLTKRSTWAKMFITQNTFIKIFKQFISSRRILQESASWWRYQIRIGKITTMILNALIIIDLDSHQHPDCNLVDNHQARMAAMAATWTPSTVQGWPRWPVKSFWTSSSFLPCFPFQHHHPRNHHHHHHHHYHHH